MLLEYLRIQTGAPYLSDLHHITMWRQVLLYMMFDKDTLEMFSIHDWQEALLFFKGEELDSKNPLEFIKCILKD